MFLLSIMAWLALLLVVFIGAVYEWRRGSPILIFYLAVFGIFLLPMLSAINGYGGHEIDICFQALVFAFFYMLAFLLIRVFLIGVLGTYDVWRPLLDNCSSLTSYLPFWSLTLFLSVCLFVIGLDITSIERVVMLDWWDLVRSGSPIVLLATYLVYVSGGISLAYFFGAKGSRLSNCRYFILFVFFLLFSVFILKTRSYLLVMLMPVLAYMLVSSKSTGLIKVALLGVLVAFLFFLARSVRHAGSIGGFIDAFSVEQFLGAMSGGELTFVDAFLFFVERNNEFPGFGENITLIRTALFWLPGFLLDLKPVEFSYYMHSAYYGSLVSDSLSMHPTVFGDAYGNAGFWGFIIYSAFLSLFFSILEFFVRLDKGCFLRGCGFSILSVSTLIFARGAIYNGFMFTLLPFVFCLFCLYFFLALSNLRVRLLAGCK